MYVTWSSLHPQEHAELKEKYVTLQETVSEQEQVWWYHVIMSCDHWSFVGTYWPGCVIEQVSVSVYVWRACTVCVVCTSIKLQYFIKFLIFTDLKQKQNCKSGWTLIPFPSKLALYSNLTFLIALLSAKQKIGDLEAAQAAQKVYTLASLSCWCTYVGECMGRG